MYNVDARWRKNITYLMFACNHMEQQRLSSEIGIQMHVCKSNNPNDKLTANDMTCSMKKFDHNVICL